MLFGIGVFLGLGCVDRCLYFIDRGIVIRGRVIIGRYFLLLIEMINVSKIVIKN